MKEVNFDQRSKTIEKPVEDPAGILRDSSTLSLATEKLIKPRPVTKSSMKEALPKDYFMLKTTDKETGMEE